MGEYKPSSIASKTNGHCLLNIDFRNKSDFMSFWKRHSIWVHLINLLDARNSKSCRF